MAEYVCMICGYVYNEALGRPEDGIAPGTSWQSLPDDWVCPICGATKAEFEKQGEVAVSSERKPEPVAKMSADMQELSPLEISALCTNLARGCEKQYKSKEAALFTELAGYFKGASLSAKNSDYSQLIALVEKDLEQGFASANAIASDSKDRGALRSLVWSEKVTRILKSLLTRYQKEGDAMLQNTCVYVCTICGFVYVGDTPPELCPVCKVPNWKFEKVEERYV